MKHRVVCGHRHSLRRVIRGPARVSSCQGPRAGKRRPCSRHVKIACP